MAASLPAQQDKYVDFRCPVCLQFLIIPTRTSCNHVFCKSCLTNVLKIKDECPTCREPVRGNTIPANDIARRMLSNKFKCHCGYSCDFANAQIHELNCNQPESPNEVRGAAALATPPRSGLGLNLPNRQTFPCSYCGERNFAREDLLQHCNALHKNAPNHRLVCTICVVYPWGDKNQKSGHLLDHLNLRHQCDYDRFVDLDQSEEESLREALFTSRLH